MPKYDIHTKPFLMRRRMTHRGMDTTTLITIILAVAIGFILGRLVSAILFARQLKNERADAATRSRAVVGGHFAEQLSPYLPGFPYKPTEVKFLGKPVDFIVFEGLDDKKITSIVFLEVKSGSASMNQNQKSLRSAVDAGRVRFETYRVPEAVTRRSAA